MRALLLVCLWTVCALVGVAHAETPKEKARAIYNDGRRAFSAGEYEAAAKKFDEAYALDATDPAYLFNAAQAYKLANKCADAADRYHEFARKAPPASHPKELDRYTADSEECAKKQAGEAKPEDAKPEAPKPEEPQPEESGKPIESMPEPVHEVDADPHRGRRIAGIVIAGAGLATIAAGVYFTFDVRSIERDREALCPPGCTWNDMLTEQAAELEDRGHKKSTIAIGAYAIGTAALAGGITLYLLGRDSHRDVAIAPTSNGAMVMGHF